MWTASQIVCKIFLLSGSLILLYVKTLKKIIAYKMFVSVLAKEM